MTVSVEKGLVAPGRRAGRVTLRWRGWSLRFRVRSVLVLLGSVVAISVAAVIGLLLGELDLSFAEVLRALTGRSSDPLATYFVTEVRLPRVVTALVVGAALGAAGAVFQNLTGNPLGSPDIIGFTTGAATGALVQIIVVGGGPTAVALGALLGGLGTAALVWLLTRRTGLTGQRLVLIGLGVGVGLAALNTLLVARASLVAAQTAAQWLAGSLNAVLWPRTGWTAVAVLALVVPLCWLSRPLSMLPLGEDVAIASGVPVQRLRTALVLLAVGLVSVATAATGPIGFVALAAPQVSRRLIGVPSPGLVGSGITGALLVLVSDLLAQHLFSPTELAVGVVTGTLGGAYLVALLALEWRRSR